MNSEQKRSEVRRDAYLTIFGRVLLFTLQLRIAHRLSKHLTKLTHRGIEITPLKKYVLACTRFLEAARFFQGLRNSGPSLLAAARPAPGQYRPQRPRAVSWCSLPTCLAPEIRQCVKANPTCADARYQKNCASELSGNRIPRDNRWIPIRRKVSPPFGETTIKNGKLPVEMRNEQAASVTRRSSAAYGAVRRSIISAPKRMIIAEGSAGP